MLLFSLEFFASDFCLDRENMLYHNPKLEELTWILEGETKVRSKKFK